MRLLSAVSMLAGVCGTGLETQRLMFIGSGAHDHMYSAMFSMSTGSISNVTARASGPGPTFLAANPSRHFLYAVNEGSGGALESFSYDPFTGDLQRINTVMNQGLVSGSTSSPHLSLDWTNSWLGASNYNGGDYYIRAVLPDGSMSALPSFANLDEGSGPKPAQTVPRAHQIIFSPDNRFFFVSDLGTDKIMQFSFDSSLGVGKPNSVAPFVSLAPGTGPRHLQFSPASPTVAYGVNELDSSVNVYSYDVENGTLTLIQTVLSYFTGDDSFAAAELAVSKDGRFLYVSNRGASNTIALFSIESPMSTGKIAELVSMTPCGGEGPRFIGFDPSYSFMLVTNQHSDNVAVFAVDKESGALTFSSTVSAENPQHVLFV